MSAMHISRTARIVLLALVMTVTGLSAAPISQADRDKAIQDLEKSRAAFLEAIADVRTEAQ
jgi:hypothetical protein